MIGISLRLPHATLQAQLPPQSTDRGCKQLQTAHCSHMSAHGSTHVMRTAAVQYTPLCQHPYIQVPCSDCIHSASTSAAPAQQWVRCRSCGSLKTMRACDTPCALLQALTHACACCLPVKSHAALKPACMSTYYQQHVFARCASKAFSYKPHPWPM